MCEVRHDHGKVVVVVVVVVVGDWMCVCVGEVVRCCTVSV